MRVGASWLAVLACVAALVTGLASPSRAAAPKVDLSDYFGGTPDEGDFRVFVADGQDDITNTASTVSVDGGRIDVLVTTTQGSSVQTDVQVFVEGKGGYQGTETQDDLTFPLAKPKLVQPILMAIGKPFKYKLTSKFLFQGSRAGKSVFSGTVTLLGFEDISTPLGDFPQAAHFSGAQKQVLKGGGQKVAIIGTSEYWVSREHGTVRRITQSRLFENGVQVDEHPPTEWLLDHGVSHGVAFPEVTATSGGGVVESVLIPPGPRPPSPPVTAPAPAPAPASGGATVITQQFPAGLSAGVPVVGGVDISTGDPVERLTIPNVPVVVMGRAAVPLPIAGDADPNSIR
jgi:hypothetical protein